MTLQQITFEFKKYCEEHNIKNPYVVKVINGKGISCSSEEEKHLYDILKDKYILNRCFNEIGYNEFLNYYYVCENRDEINIKKFYPCLSASHECIFDCEKFAECALKGTWSPE